MKLPVMALFAIRKAIMMALITQQMLVKLFLNRYLLLEVNLMKLPVTDILALIDTYCWRSKLPVTDILALITQQMLVKLFLNRYLLEVNLMK